MGDNAEGRWMTFIPAFSMITLVMLFQACGKVVLVAGAWSHILNVQVHLFRIYFNHLLSLCMRATEGLTKLCICSRASKLSLRDYSSVIRNEAHTFIAITCVNVPSLVQLLTYVCYYLCLWEACLDKIFLLHLSSFINSLDDHLLWMLCFCHGP